MSRRRRHFARPLAALGVALLAGEAAAAGPVTGPDFCIRVQQLVAATTLEPRNTVHPDYAAFKQSKTSIDPLTSHQFVLADEATGVPRRVSCKVKTPDHLVAHFGAGAASDPGLGCAGANRDTVSRVYASLDLAERSRVRVPESAWRFDPDSHTYLGSTWVEPYAFLYRTDDAAVHLHAKSLRVDWENFWLAWAADRFRGVLYCHLAAPEYVRQIALGEVAAPGPPVAD
jgi:hypothetical protein